MPDTQSEGRRAFPPEIQELAKRHGYAVGFMTTDDTVFLPVFLKVVPADELVAVHVLDGMDDADPVLRLVMRSEQFALLAASTP